MKNCLKQNISVVLVVQNVKFSVLVRVVSVYVCAKSQPNCPKDLGAAALKTTLHLNGKINIHWIYRS